MSCRLSELVVHATDPEALARFWCDVLGYVEIERDDAGDVVEIGPAEGFGGRTPTLVFLRTTERRHGRLRLHLDVSPVDREQDAELERLLGLGARPADVGQPADATWHVLTDPEGNEFCLLRNRLPEL